MGSQPNIYTDNSTSVRELEDTLMAIRIRETDTVAELKEMRQKVMELETQNHVCTNQIRRQDEEYKKLKDENERLLQRDREGAAHIRDEQIKKLEAETAVRASLFQAFIPTVILVERTSNYVESSRGRTAATNSGHAREVRRHRIKACGEVDD
jgi:chromosome segregation ATPase